MILHENVKPTFGAPARDLQGLFGGGMRCLTRTVNIPLCHHHLCYACAFFDWIMSWRSRTHRWVAHSTFVYDFLVPVQIDFFFYEKLFDGFIMHQNNFFVPAPFALKCDLIAYNLHIFFLNKDRPNRVCARSMKLYDWNYYLILTSSYNTKKCMHAKWISIHLIKWIKIIM